MPMASECIAGELDCRLFELYDEYGLALRIGLLCLGVQLACTALFKALPAGGSFDTTRFPVFLAHQVVALPLMILLTYMGCAAYYSPAADSQLADAAGAHGRSTYPVAAGRDISLVILGMQLFWDLPVTLHAEMYDAVNLAHPRRDGDFCGPAEPSRSLLGAFPIGAPRGDGHLCGPLALAVRAVLGPLLRRAD